MSLVHSGQQLATYAVSALIIGTMNNVEQKMGQKYTLCTSVWKQQLLFCLKKTVQPQVIYVHLLNQSNKGEAMSGRRDIIALIMVCLLTDI